MSEQTSKCEAAACEPGLKVFVKQERKADCGGYSRLERLLMGRVGVAGKC